MQGLNAFLALCRCILLPGDLAEEEHIKCAKLYAHLMHIQCRPKHWRKD